VDSLQAWGFALRATTLQVAFGYDPTRRSVYFIKRDRILYLDIRHSLFDIWYSLFQSFFYWSDWPFFGQRRRFYETPFLARVGAVCNRD